MARSPHFSQKVKSEQNLYEDIVIESLKIYGQDVYYLPRTIVNENTILGEDVASSFSSSYKIEMYLENQDGFDGEGDLFTKFGVEIRDEATFIVARKSWARSVSSANNNITVLRPKEGDLVYLELSNKIFEIMHVEHEQPFYQLSNLPTYKLRCQLFEYSGEDIDTGITEINKVQSVHFKSGISEVWGLQYHPEITYHKMITLINFRKDKLIHNRKCFNNETEIQNHIKFIEEEIKRSIKNSRMLELKNWLDYLKAA